MFKKIFTFNFLVSLIFLAGCVFSSFPPKPEGMLDAQYQKVIEKIKQAQKKIDQATKDQFPTQAYLELGLNYYILQDYPDAETTFEKVLKEDSKNYLALNNLASSYEEQKKYAQALTFYKQLVKFYPEQWEGLEDALRIFKELKRQREGQSFLESFIRTYPKDKQDAKFTQFVSKMYQYLKEG